MKLHRSASFVADLERQFEWHVTNAGWDVADRYLAAVEAACRLLERHPRLGPLGGFQHPRLQHWHFLVVARPFQRHLLFYELTDGEVILRRAMHGHRNLPRRLLE